MLPVLTDPAPEPGVGKEGLRRGSGKMNDLECWMGIRSGDLHALSMLYERYAVLLYDYGKKITRDESLLEDALHDLFLNLLRENLSEPASVKAYLYKAFRNQLLKNLRWQQHVALLDFECNVDTVYNEGSQRIERRQLAEKIRQLLAALPPRQREILYLRFFQELSFEEISEIMSIHVHSAYKLLYKAIDKLRILFEREPRT